MVSTRRDRAEFTWRRQNCECGCTGVPGHQGTRVPGYRILIPHPLQIYPDLAEAEKWLVKDDDPERKIAFQCSNYLDPNA